MSNKKHGPQAPRVEPTGSSFICEDYSQGSTRSQCEDENSQAQQCESIETPPENQATRYLRLVVESGVELFHDEQMTGFARVKRAGHWEIYALESKSFKDWLMPFLMKKLGHVPQDRAMDDLVNSLRALAVYDSPGFPVFVRVAHVKNKVYLDLCNEDWQVVEVSSTGWKVIDESPVRFRRAPDSMQLPAPEKGGRIDELKEFLNLESDEDFILVIEWLIGALWGKGACPILVINGEQGSAKTTAVRILKSLVDPSIANVRSAPRTQQELMIAAKNCRVLTMDNLSKVDDWLSDALCRVVTGTSFSARKLYTDSDEAILCAQNPVILNGITDLVERPDLLERSIVIHLPRIDDSKRRTEEELFQDFEHKRGRLLGALLQIVSVGLRRVNKIKPERLPRMADFAKVALACEVACPWPEGSFLQAYEVNHDLSRSQVLDSPLVRAVHQILDECPGKEWTGTATDLLELLNRNVLWDKRPQDWPKQHNILSGQLNRLAPDLLRIGIEFRREKSSDGRSRLIKLKLRPKGTTTVCESVGRSVMRIGSQSSASDLRPDTATDDTDGSDDHSLTKKVEVLVPR